MNRLLLVLILDFMLTVFVAGFRHSRSVAAARMALATQASLLP